MLLAETWIKDETNLELEKKFGLNVYTSSRKNRVGGGVMILTSKSVIVEKHWEFSDDSTEMIGIYSPNLNTIIMSCYIPPVNNYLNTVTAFDEMREFMNNSPADASVIIYGDFNLNCLTYERNKDDILEPNIIGGPPKDENEENVELSGNAAEKAIASKLINISDEFDLSQIVEKPTFRKHGTNGKSYLDRIFTNIENTSNIEHIESNKTRHDILQVKMEISVSKEPLEEEQEEEMALNLNKVDYTSGRCRLKPESA